MLKMKGQLLLFQKREYKSDKIHIIANWDILSFHLAPAIDLSTDQ